MDICVKNTIMISSTHLHAMVVHFPIALLLVGFLFEVLSFFYKKDFFYPFALNLLFLGMLGTIVSYLAGNAAGSGMEEGDLSKAMELHEQAATITLWLTILTAAVHAGIYFSKNTKNWMKIAGLVLFASVVISLARTGYLGGDLVYKHGAGVELALPDFSNPNPE